MQQKELEIIEGAKRLLSMYGAAEVVYTTAEFAPFSNQQMPDLTFVPASYSPNRFIYFIEYKKEPKFGFNIPYFITVLDQKKFVEEDSELPIKYGFATNVDLTSDIKDFLIENEIELLTNIENDSGLFHAIRDWSSVINHP